MKKIVSLIMAACLLFSLMISTASAVVYPSTGRTRVANVALRSEPSTKGKKVASFSKKGYELTVEGEEEVDGILWYQVTTPKGKTGYVQGIYLSVEDNDFLEAVEENSQAKTMSVSVTGRCDDYKGLGKKYSQLFEINGIALPTKKPTAKLAADEEFSLLSYLSNKNASGTEKSTYTPTAEELTNGFTVTQTVTCISNKTQKEIVWVMTWTFMPEGAKATASKNDKNSKDSKDSKAGSSNSANYSGTDISYDLSSSETKPTAAVKREIDHYEEKEMEVTERVVVGYKTYIAYEVDEKGKAKEVEKQKPVYELQKVKKMVKVPVYKDEMPEGSTDTSTDTDTSKTDETGTGDDGDIPEEEEDYDSESEEEE